MSSNKFSDEFKRDAVAQITERGYPVREVSQRLGVSPYSLYAWKKKFAKASSGEAEKDTEIRPAERRQPQRQLPRSIGLEQSGTRTDGAPVVVPLRAAPARASCAS